MDLDVTGMHCASCAGSIEAALKKAPGVETAVVNFALRRAYVEGTASYESLAAVVRRAGYGISPAKDEVLEEQASELKQKRKQIYIAGFMALAIFAIAMFGLKFPGSDWVQAVLAIGVIVSGGRDIFLNAWRLLLKRSANMDSLVALGVGSAMAYSFWMLFSGETTLYFESAAVIVALVQLGRYLEDRARVGAAQAIKSLIAMRPKTATLIETDGSERQVLIDSLEADQIFVVRSGEQVATDGEVIRGEGEMDESMLSGESELVLKKEGDSVFGATINRGKAALHVKTTKVGGETVFANIIRLVEQAQATKAELQRTADRIAAIFVPGVLVFAGFTFFAWFLIEGHLGHALIPAVSVLLIACPCALGLATPTAFLAGSGRAATRHILIRSAEGLELAGQVDCVVLDKTGTLTRGRPAVKNVSLFHGANEPEVCAMAAGLAQQSTHPLSAAVVEYAKGLNITPVGLSNCEETAGLGVVGNFEGALLKLGSSKFTGGTVKDVPGTQIFLKRNEQVLAAFLLEDEIRDGTKRALEELNSMGLELVLASGDRQEEAERVGQIVGIPTIYGGMSPEDKLKLVEELKNRGKRVAFVGDGINDAPALAAAQVGLAVQGATDVASGAASIVLMNASLESVAVAIRLSRRTVSVIKQNLMWAFVYNLVAVPIAAFGFLSPMIAAGAMAASSISVVLNSLRLRYV